MITFPLILLRGLFLRSFGKYVASALPFIDIGIAFGLVLIALGLVINIWKIVCARKR
jgi:hypothetical protein